MTWICNTCKNLNANVVKQCYYCIHHFGIRINRSDIIDIYDEIDMSNTKYEIWKTLQVENGLELAEFTRIKQIMSDEKQEANFEANPNMNPREKLFARFFASEVALVQTMDDSALHAHIEDLQAIAFEARARLTASDSAARERAAKKKAAKGFAATVAVDTDFTSNAINNIEQRKKKMSKVEKEIERLVDLGISRADAENMYRATTVNAIKKGNIGAVVKDVTLDKPERKEDNENSLNHIIDSVVNFTPEQKKDFTNPFAPKVEVVEVIEEKIEVKVEEVKIEEIKVEVKEETRVTTTFINPFASK